MKRKPLKIYFKFDTLVALQSILQVVVGFEIGMSLVLAHFFNIFAFCLYLKKHLIILRFALVSKFSFQSVIFNHSFL